MNSLRNWGQAGKHLLVALVFTAVAVAGFSGAYWLEEPVVWTDNATGVQLKLLRHAELWQPVDRRHPLDIAPGERIVSVEPAGGLAHVTVHRLSCDAPIDPSQLIEQIDTARRVSLQLYSTFWNSPPERGSWRMERSFRGHEGLKTIKRVSGGPGTPLGTELVFDYVIESSAGCWWYVGAYVPEVMMRYYELDVKYILASIQLSSPEGSS